MMTAVSIKMIWVILFITLLAPKAMAVMKEMTWKMDPDRMTIPTPWQNISEYQYSYQLRQAGPGGPSGNINFTAFGTYSTIEHIGTHLDAPYHFSHDGKHVDEIPLEDLTGPLVAINVTQRATVSPDTEVQIADILAWESKYGPLPDRAFVLMNSGWDEYYGDDAKYLGTVEGSSEMHFPGFSGEVSRWLLTNRNILGVGTDTLGCDAGIKVNESGTHQSILPANKVCIENLRHVSKVPECGARFMMLPLMLRNGTGCQGRALAEWYEGVGFQTTCNGTLRSYDGLFDQSSSADKAAMSISILMIASVIMTRLLYLK